MEKYQPDFVQKLAIITSLINKKNYLILDFHQTCSFNRKIYFGVVKFRDLKFFNGYFWEDYVTIKLTLNKHRVCTEIKETWLFFKQVDFSEFLVLKILKKGTGSL